MGNRRFGNFSLKNFHIFKNYLGIIVILQTESFDEYHGFVATGCPVMISRNNPFCITGPCIGKSASDVCAI